MLKGEITDLENRFIVKSNLKKKKNTAAEGREGMGIGSGKVNLSEGCVLIKEHF